MAHSDNSITLSTVISLFVVFNHFGISKGKFGTAVHFLIDYYNIFLSSWSKTSITGANMPLTIDCLDTHSVYNFDFIII